MHFPRLFHLQHAKLDGRTCIFGAKVQHVRSDRVVVDPNILTGKPVVRGTRISVELVVELFAAGWSHAQVLASHPHLSEDDIRANTA